MNEPTSDWEKSFEKECVGTIDGQEVAFVPLTKTFIHSLLAREEKRVREDLLKQVMEIRLKNLYSTIGEGEAYSLGWHDFRSEIRILLRDIIRQHTK